MTLRSRLRELSDELTRRADAAWLRAEDLDLARAHQGAANQRGRAWAYRDARAELLAALTAPDDATEALRGLVGSLNSDWTRKHTLSPWQVEALDKALSALDRERGERA